MSLPERKDTNALHELMDNGVLDPRVVADACLKYMSEYEVGNMAFLNEFTPLMRALSALDED